MRRRSPVGRDALREDSVAGLVVGVQSVPDGLAVSVLAEPNGSRGNGAIRLSRTRRSSGSLHVGSPR